MGIKKVWMGTGMVIAGITVLSGAEGAEALFDAKCAVCHSKTRPTDMNRVTAPAVAGVMHHIKMRYPKRDAALRFIEDYVMSPSQKKAICMPQKIARFGLMPSQKGSVTEAELKRISAWMFDHFPPKEFHGGHGKGHGNGMRRNQNKI